MSINKNFVVKNGFEVSTNLILANADTRRVGVGSTNPRYTLDVFGGIGATDFYATGIGTFASELNVGLGGTVLSVTDSVGVGTALPAYLLDIRSPVSTGQTALYVQGDVRITGDLNVDDITFDDATVQDLTVTDTFNVAGLSTFSSNAFINAELSVAGFSTFSNSVQISNDLNVIGISTLGTVEINSGIISSTSGIVTYYGDGSNLTGITTSGGDVILGFTTVTDLNITDNLFVSGISTFGNIVLDPVGIITAVTGIVTYYGDGTYLDLSSNSTIGIGIGTTGGVVGYGITFIDFYGAGVSTTFYDSNVGIATIFFEGGGGSGTIGIGTEFPVSATNGDLFFSAEFGRLFVYYDEVVIGTGSSAFWIDAAPFNINLSQLDDLQVNNLVVFNSTNLNHLNVTGISTLNNLIVGDINSSGISTLSNVNVTGISTLSNVNVTGISTLSNLIVGDINSSGIVTAVDFNSTSDQNLKNNIQTVENALEIVSSLRGVSFDWKETGKSSYGVIAQELEEVLPSLVSDGEIKTVNYNGIIGVLIEAIKELKNEIEEIRGV